MVDTGRPHLGESPFVLVIQIWAYLLVVAGVWFTVTPWRLRDLLHWATANEKRVRVGNLIRLAFAGFVVLLSAGPLIRNAVIYGTPLDPAQVSVHSNLLGDPRALLSNLLRNLALNAGTPSTHVNKAIYLAIVQIHEWIGLVWYKLRGR
jgi:hypothetical protein